MAHVTKRVYPAKKKYTKKYFTDLKIKAEKKARLEKNLNNLKEDITNIKEKMEGWF